MKIKHYINIEKYNNNNNTLVIRITKFIPLMIN